MWVKFVSVFCFAFVLSLFFTPLVRKMALKFHIIEKSNPRKKHKRVITCIGGLVMHFFIFFKKI